MYKREMSIPYFFYFSLIFCTTHTLSKNTSFIFTPFFLTKMLSRFTFQVGGIAIGVSAISRVYFGFALADSMFTDGVIVRQSLTVEQVSALIQTGVVSCCNPSHVATITAMRNRFGLDVAIPEQPPRVAVADGDSVIVMGVRGLPRLTDRHEYTEDEVVKATFVFSLYSFSA
jgi:hypothetical protein